ncbi:MAG TPA: hypothetical protein VFL51_03725, partial [Pseudolabrys sp.]|nr:hypothetical protein [Pseudolabrys sp.]
AIEDYSAALRLQPGLASALYGRGLAKRESGDASGAEADFAAAKKFDARIAEEFSHYGVK